MAKVFISIGSNLSNPVDQVKLALKKLGKNPLWKGVKSSSLYSTKPVGSENQPDYCNAVAELETLLEPEALLDELQKMEYEQGRIRLTKWGPRTLDLDILLYEDSILETKRLTIPHPRMFERGFVLKPLQDLLPNFCLPGGEDIKKLLKECADNGSVKKIY